MKKGFQFCLIMAVVLFAGKVHADFYKLGMVTRVDSNLYSFRSGMAEGIVQTKYCYEYAMYDDAVLKYDRYGYDNKIIFSNGTVCDVAGVYSK